MRTGILMLLSTFLWFHAGAMADVTSAKSVCAISISDINSEISKDGARKAIGDIYKADHWDTLMQCIASGDAKWIHVATKLNSAADGTAAEDLAIAVAEALGNNPKGVLELARPSFRLAEICAAPDSEDPRFGSYALAMAEISKREIAVATMMSTKFSKDATSCHGYLEDAKKWVAHTFDVAPESAPASTTGE